jgi:hypothetical protein
MVATTFKAASTGFGTSVVFGDAVADAMEVAAVGADFIAGGAAAPNDGVNSVS